MQIYGLKHCKHWKATKDTLTAPCYSSNHIIESYKNMTGKRSSVANPPSKKDHPGSKPSQLSVCLTHT